MLLYQILACTMHGKISLYKNNKCKTSAVTWNEEFELPDGIYSASDIFWVYYKKNTRQLLIILQ